ncbi:hypothetical protein TPA0907_12890 [Micromonospora humidisoli]|nr:hypothetical protein TPA0907_12890 [Micromonospora sp. AKA109]
MLDQFVHGGSLGRVVPGTAAAAQPPAPHRLTEDNIRHLVGSFDDIRNTLRDADSRDKSTVYRELRLALTYNPGKTKSASRLRLTLITVG